MLEQEAKERMELMIKIMKSRGIDYDPTVGIEQENQRRKERREAIRELVHELSHERKEVSPE